MNKIEQILNNVLKERLNITLEKYQQMVSSDEVEYDKALIEAGIIECLRMTNNKKSCNLKRKRIDEKNNY